MTRSSLAAFVAGAGVMSLEILTSRLLAPSFGFTVETWAIIISVTLLSSALGALVGGRLGRRASWKRLGSLLLLAGVWIAGAVVLGPALIETLEPLPILLGAVLATALLLCVPIVLLGAVLPVAVARTKRDEEFSTSIGRLIAWSTFGSLVGTLVAAFVFTPTIGVAMGGVCTGLALVCSAIWVVSGDRGANEIIAILLVAALGVYGLGREREGIATPYGQLTFDAYGPGGWTMAIDGIPQATLSPLVSSPGDLLSKRNYVELLPYLRPLGTVALQVGLGGGLMAQALERYGIQTQSFEINPGVVSVLRERLQFDGEVTIGDGRALLRRTDDRFDFVILDAFQGESVPSHLLTVEAFEDIAAHLRPSGVVCIHLIGHPAHQAIESVAKTLGRVFRHVMACRSGVADELQDIYLFASARALVVPSAPELSRHGWLGNETFVPDTRDAFVLTDDQNPLDRLHAPLGRMHRRAAMRSR